MVESYFNNVELGDVQSVVEAVKKSEAVLETKREEMLKIAGAVVKITELPEWQIILAKIEELKMQFVRKPEDYYMNEKIAGIDSGARAALTLLTNWLARQTIIIDKSTQQQ